MAESDGVVVAETPPPETAGKLAGKFENIEALEKGYRELRNHAKLPEIKDKPLFGKGGVYTDAVALEQGYKDLEVIVTRPPKVESKPAPVTTGDGLSVTPTEPVVAITEKGVQGVLKKAGLTGQEQALAEQWKANKALTEDHYKAFEKAGRDRDEVDAFFAGQEAIAERNATFQTQVKNEAATAVGGQEKVDMLRSWASQTPTFLATLRALNKAVEADPSFYPTMMTTIAAAYAKSTGTEGSKHLINGAAAPGTNSTAFSNRTEWLAARERVLKGTASDLDKSRITATPMSGPRG